MRVLVVVEDPIGVVARVPELAKRHVWHCVVDVMPRELARCGHPDQIHPASFESRFD